MANDPIIIPYDENGNPVSYELPVGYTKTEHKGGVLHNGAESSIVMTDTDFAVFGAGETIWGDGSSVWNEVSYADLLVALSFSMGLVMQWQKDGDVCLLKEAVQFPYDQGWTPAEYIKSKNWAERYTDEDECGAGALVPYEVTSGGIGPNETWFELDGGNVYLVEDS